MPQSTIKKHLIRSYPNLSIYLANSPPIKQIESKNINVLSAISKIIIGQMLSRKAASTIFQRAESLSAKHGKSEIAMLSIEELRSCGISRSKCKAINLFAKQYYEDVARYENWRNLESNTLFNEVNKRKRQFFPPRQTPPLTLKA